MMSGTEYLGPPLNKKDTPTPEPSQSNGMSSGWLLVICIALCVVSASVTILVMQNKQKADEIVDMKVTQAAPTTDPSSEEIAELRGMFEAFMSNQENLDANPRVLNQYPPYMPNQEPRKILVELKKHDTLCPYCRGRLKTFSVKAND
jgi:hypothetical protein